MSRRNAKVKRWTAAEAGRHLADWRASGERLETFARRRGLVGQRLRWWRERLGADAGRVGVEAGASFVPVVVRGGPEAESVGVCVVVDGVARIEVRELTTSTAAWIGMMLAAVREPRA